MRNCLDLNFRISRTGNLPHHSLACLLPGRDLGRGDTRFETEEDLELG